MNDREFLAAFDSDALPDGFHHGDHIRLAWIYLRDHSVVEAIDLFAGALKRFAAAKGASGLYHETITWAYLLLIHERMARGHLIKGEGPRDDCGREPSGQEGTWDAFRAANADLFRWTPSLLDDYYRPETLQSELARRVFVLPDRVLGSAPHPR
jgi:hypothetical protein